MGGVRRGDGFQVVAQVAGGGEERWFAVFVAAVAGDGAQLCQGFLQVGAVCLIDREAEELAVVGDVLTTPQAGADNDLLMSRD